MNTQDLATFLKEAHANTWANKDAAKAAPSRLKSEDYHFEQGNLAYHDTYFANRDFIGGELIYEESVPAWGMNYFGYILSTSANAAEVYGFLRRVLLQTDEDTIPVRGPREFKEGDWTYINTPTGDLSRFMGNEVIQHGRELVYRADYHGGFIS